MQPQATSFSYTPCTLHTPEWQGKTLIAQNNNSCSKLGQMNCYRRQHGRSNIPQQQRGVHLASDCSLSNFSLGIAKAEYTETAIANHHPRSASWSCNCNIAHHHWALPSLSTPKQDLQLTTNHHARSATWLRNGNFNHHNWALPQSLLRFSKCQLFASRCIFHLTSYCILYAIAMDLAIVTFSIIIIVTVSLPMDLMSWHRSTTWFRVAHCSSTCYFKTATWPAINLMMVTFSRGPVSTRQYHQDKMTNLASLVLITPIGRWRRRKMLQLVLESKLKHAELLTSILTTLRTQASNDHVGSNPRETINFLQKHPLQWSRKLQSFFLWQDAQRRASVSYCATELVCLPLNWRWRSWPVSCNNMVGLCNALIKQWPQSPQGPTSPTSWKTPILLGGMWVIGRAQPHH